MLDLRSFKMKNKQQHCYNFVVKLFYVYLLPNTHFNYVLFQIVNVSSVFELFNFTVSSDFANVVSKRSNDKVLVTNFLWNFGSGWHQFMKPVLINQF
jgi:hypothetical protein